MQTPGVWPYFSPSCVGALMEPAFLRGALRDEAMRLRTDLQVPSPSALPAGLPMGRIAAAVAMYLARVESAAHPRKSSESAATDSSSQAL